MNAPYNIDYTPRRLQYIHADAAILSDLFRETERGITFSVTRGMPADAKFVRCEVHSYGKDLHAPTFYFVFEHESFDEVQSGEEIPPFTVIFSAHFSPELATFKASEA